MIHIHRLSYGAVPHYSPCFFLLSIPLANSLFSLSPSYLLGIPPLVWCDPVHLGPRLLVNWPPPPHSNFPTPRGFPKSTVCPTKTTSRSRLYIVWNNVNSCLSQVGPVSRMYWLVVGASTADPAQLKIGMLSATFLSLSLYIYRWAPLTQNLTTVDNS
jgi:hypothetical protein